MNLLHFNLNNNTRTRDRGRILSNDIEEMDEDEELEFKDKLELRAVMTR